LNEKKSKDKRKSEEEVRAWADEAFTTWDSIQEWWQKEPAERMKELKEWVVDEVNDWNSSHKRQEDAAMWTEFGYPPGGEVCFIRE
jgi:hypothetical protein